MYIELIQPRFEEMGISNIQFRPIPGYCMSAYATGEYRDQTVGVVFGREIGDYRRGAEALLKINHNPKSRDFISGRLKMILKDLC